MLDPGKRPRPRATRQGVPEDIFNEFFGKKDADKRTAELARQQSVLDLCREQAKALSRQVSAADRTRLDEYFNTLRETETFLERNRDFISKPAPDTGYVKEDFQHEYLSGMFPLDYAAYYESLLRCALLAFKFDLTRVAHLSLHYVGPGHHGATHHGGREKSVSSLHRHDSLMFDKFAGLLTEFKNTQMPEGGTLMDQTISLYAGALGSAAAHSGKDLPAIVAGGKFRHGSFIRYEQPQDISNLYLTGGGLHYAMTKHWSAKNDPCAGPAQGRWMGPSQPDRPAFEKSPQTRSAALAGA